MEEVSRMVEEGRRAAFHAAIHEYRERRERREHRARAVAANILIYDNARTMDHAILIITLSCAQSHNDKFEASDRL